MARRSHGVHTEDTTAIINGVNEGMKSYARGQDTVRVSDLLMEYNGDANQLTRAIAGLPGTGKLPARGTDDRKAYDAAARSVNRWLNWEKGTGKQARNPNNKATQEKLKSLMAKKRPPTSASVSITGWVYYDEDARWRSIPVSGTISLSGSAFTSFLQNMQEGNTHGAYHNLFSAYGASVLSLGAEDSPQVQIDFS